MRCRCIACRRRCWTSTQPRQGCCWPTVSSRKAPSATRCSSAAGCTTCVPSPGPGTRSIMSADPPSSPWKRRPPRPAARPAASRSPRDEEAVTPVPGAAAVRRGRDEELRLHGFNAVQAVFARRPHAIRKLYLAQARIPQLQPLLKWCVANRVGYRVVGEADLRKLAASAHHEGVVADVLREPPLSLAAWLGTLPPGPCCALWLDGVGNPHNLGAILRSAA